MANLWWYCCACNYAYNLPINDFCSQCGQYRYPNEKIEKTPLMLPTTPRLTGEDRPTEQETTRKAPSYSASDKERLQPQTTQEEAVDSTVSSSKDPGMPKWLLQSFESGRELFRRGTTTRTDTSPDNPMDDIRSERSPTPQGSSSSVRPEYSSTSSIVYSLSLGFILADWVREQFSCGV
ncbi:hypothetical protein N7517_004613 [Penicillium concentricum]|uniref:Uncharacterized protein n=1 Tax=Penicillium concentricum TaxID=293559 RepID=A0A9W9S5U0_9EURO|nr:uncharacterized protein N7517_004613 [Penicillium concentricum]KAJ5372607.1 hypothetical protein N7517_004613 [Penicillium concentricum]